MPLIFQKIIYRQDLKANPNVVYVFGDNELGIGMGGQAGEMRGEPNAFGIPTKRAPGANPEDYWSDNNLSHNLKILEDKFQAVSNMLADGKIVVFPLDGIGTGLSRMPELCPLTYSHIQIWLKTLVQVHNKS